MGKNRSKDALPDVLKPIPEGDSALMRKKNRTPTMVLAISIVVLSILGSGYLLLEAHQRKKSIQADLISIADIKATQIANWYNERYEDASQIKETVLLQEMAIEHLSNPGNKSNAEDLKKWALIIKQPNDYTWIALLNKQGEVVLSITEDNKTLSKFHNQYFHEVMSSGKIVMADLHTDLDARGEKASEVFMSFWIPVVAPQASNTKPQGVWLVQIDPTRFLYPLVQSWPVNTKTAETLLVRKEGSEVVFLNELRHQKNTAAKLRYKLADNPDLPAAKAVSGVEGLVESNDYRNVPVVSALRKVYGTPWYMIAKMDKQELYQPLKVRMWLSLLVAVILVLAIALTYGYMERQRDSIWLNQQLILQQAKAKLQQDYEHIAKEWQSTFDSISDVVWLLDTNWKIIRSNNYKAGSVPGVPEQIVGAFCWEAFHGLNKPVQNCPYLTMKETKARASTELEMDGKWYQISVDPILDEEKEIIGAVHIIRDISQKIATEQALAYSELKFRNVFENSIAGKSLTSMDGTVNPNTALCNMLGYSQGEMKHKWQDFTHPDDVELTQKIIDSILAGEKEGARFIKRYQHKDGSVVWADVSTVLQRDYDGKPLYFMNTILDITSQKLAEEEIVKMNRVYAVISEINQMMVRTRDARVILQEACRISIDFGKFKMAWIGEVDLQEEIVKPLLWAGDENGYFSVIPNISTKDVPEGRGPCGMAVQTMKYFYCNDIANDPCMEPWRDSALKNGYRSVISMPIVLHNRVELVFTMYSEELNFFNEMEIRLLEEVTGDISYALEMNELEQAKRQSEDDLKKSEYRFHELFEHLSNGVSVYQSTEDNSDFYICDINPAGQRITNSHKEYIIGLKASEVFPDLRNKGLLDVFREVYNTGITKQCDTFNYQENKLEYWLNNKVLKLESGEIVAIYEDATQRMSAEHELRETNQYLQNLLDYANAPIIVWNANYLIERFNRAFEHLTQYSAEEILGKHLSLFFPPESRDSNMSLIRLASKVSSWESVELPIQRKDMQIRIVLWNSAIVYEDDGKTLLSTIAQGQDITERIEAERMVAESEERLRVIVDNAPFGAHAFVLMPDNRLILTGANLSADKILGIDNQALLGKELLEAFPGNAGTEIPQIYRRVALGGENYQAEQIVYEAEGISGAFEIHAVNTGKNRVTVFFREITEKKKADDAIKKLNEELEQRVIARTADLQIANKELEAFSYSVSHDLRSPLRGIDGWSQALFDDYESVLDGQAKIYLERIRAEAVRMSQLIEGLLKLAHIGKVDITTVQVNLSSLAKNIINRLQEESGDRIVDVHIQNDLSAMGDNNLLEIVLTNLLNNAWKFTTKTEQAKIEFGKGIANSPDNAGHKTVFYVKDNGAGFDMAYASKLFGVFQRMHKAAEFPGTGVGLATVQRIINRHGGEIWVEAHPNKGATFYFTLKEGS